jgi:hypothetical protein
MMRGYLQLAAGLGEMSRRKAMEAARDLIDGSSVSALRTGPGAGPEAIAGQVTALADELLAIGRQNRSLLAALVRTETEAVLASLGGRADRERADDRAERGLGRLDEQLRVLRDRVDELERQLRQRAGGASVSPGTRATTPRPVRKSTTTAKTAASTGTTRTSATAGKATAKKSTAKKSTARRAAARTSTARTSTRRTSPRSSRRTGAGS